MTSKNRISSTRIAERTAARLNDIDPGVSMFPPDLDDERPEFAIGICLGILDVPTDLEMTMPAGSTEAALRQAIGDRLRQIARDIEVVAQKFALPDDPMATVLDHDLNL